MSVIYFSVFSPEIFQTEVKNIFLSNRSGIFKSLLKKKLNQEQSKTKTENNTTNNNKTKSTYFRTTSNYNLNTNTSNNNINIRDIISSKKRQIIKTPKKKNKYITSYFINEKIQPYKQYLLEKRQYENIKKEKDRYNLESKNKNESPFLPKNKIKGINFATQKGFGFFDQYVESKNYSKNKINNNRRPIVMIRRNKYDEIDLSLLEDIKNGKRKNVFDENFGVKSLLRYNKFRLKAISFMKLLDDNPNYNY